MKKLLLSTAVLFLTVTVFGQTTIENKNAIKNKTNAQTEQKEIRVSNEGSVESGTSIHSNVVQNAKSTLQKQKQTASTAKEKAVSKTKSTAGFVKQNASKDVSISGSAQTHANVNASAKSNNASVSQDANSGIMLSTKGLQNDNAIKGKQQNGAIIEKGTKVKSHAENTAIQQKGKLKSGTANTIKAGASSVNTIKPHPVTIKTNALLKTSGGLHLR